MAQSMKDVKAITIPEGIVKKIEDSNGNIIWGSYDAFPYRRLEYIHFNGTDNYLDPLVRTKAGWYRFFQFDLERNDVRQSTFCMYNGTVNSALRRYYAADFEPANGVRFCCGGTWSTGVALSNIPLNTKLSISVVNSTVSSKPRMQFNLKKFTNNTWTNIISTTTLDGTTNGTLPNTGPYLMGCHTVNTNVDQLENPSQGKLYYFEERQGTYQGTLTHQMYPVQRKSDGICGLYDIATQQFCPMVGSNITDAATGPVVDEYWDLTAPS